MAKRMIVPLVLAALAAAASAGTPEGEPKSRVADSVLVRTGDRVTGRITSMGADGFLRMTAPYLENEIALRASALREATFVPTADESGAHVVLLTNGDRIAGTVVAVTATEVAVESSVAGKLVVGRPFVQSIQFRPIKSGPPRVDFEAGETEPFQPVPGRPNALSVEYVQDKPFTVEAEFAEAGSTACSIGVLVADPRNPRQNAMTLSWTEDGLSIRTASGNGSSNWGMGNMLGNERLRTLRFSYNPKTRQLDMQLNGRQNWNNQINSSPAKGRYIVIEHSGVMPLRRFQVTEGTGSAADAKPLEDPNHEIVVLANEDSVTADSVALADGRLNVKSEVGDLLVPVDRLGALFFRTSARKLPAVKPKAVRVRTARSTLTLDSIVLDEKALTGSGAFSGGPLRIERAALKAINFSPPTPAPAAPVSPAPAVPGNPAIYVW